MDRHSTVLPTELGRNLLGQETSEVNFVCFKYHFTCWTLFMIEHDLKGHEDLGWQLNVDLAQLVEH